MTDLVVLTRVSGGWLDRLGETIPGVRVVTLPTDGPPPAGLNGEVLLTYAAADPHLEAILACGIRWVHTFGTGVDRFPIDAVGDRILTCSRGASAQPIAEWVMAMLLAAAKNLPGAWVHDVPERWNVDRSITSLRGSRIAILGFGSIGRETARLLSPFGAEVVVTRRTDTDPGMPGARWLTDVGAAVEDADHVIISAASTPETTHLVSSALLARMKEGVHVVNIARGALVDQEALRQALDRGHVGRASLDTVDPEPLPEGHWLYSHPRVHLSPHVSWTAPDARAVLQDHFVANLRRYLAGQPLEGVVSPEAGY